MYSTVRERVLNETKLQVVGNQIKLYEIRFRTSNYGDFMQKMDATTTNQVVYKVKKPIGNSRVSVTVDEAKLANNTAIITAINTALGKPASYKPTISYAEQILQRGGERFDLYDLKPYVKTVAGKTIFRSPKVVYNTADAKDFHLKMTNKLVKILQLTGKAYKDLEVESDMSLGFVSQVSGSPTILLAAEEGLTQNVPSHLPSFAGPNDFLFSENANTTAGSMTNGRHVIDFKSNWLGLDESDGNGNPHIYTGNFMNGNGYQPQSAQDFENIGAAMDAVDEEINALQMNNTSVKPTVQSAAAPKAATGATGATGGGK